MTNTTLNTIANHIARGVTNHNLSYTDAFVTVSSAYQRKGDTTLLHITGTQDAILVASVSAIVGHEVDADVIVENDNSEGFEVEFISEDDGDGVEVETR